MICPLCDRDAPIVGGVFVIHYNSGLWRCPNSGQPAGATNEPTPEVVEQPKPAKKAAPRKKATPKP